MKEDFEVPFDATPEQIKIAIKKLKEKPPWAPGTPWWHKLMGFLLRTHK